MYIMWPYFHEGTGAGSQGGGALDALRFPFPKSPPGWELGPIHQSQAIFLTPQHPWRPGISWNLLTLSSLSIESSDSCSFFFVPLDLRKKNQQLFDNYFKDHQNFTWKCGKCLHVPTEPPHVTDSILSQRPLGLSMKKTSLKLEPLQYPRDFDFGWGLQVGTMFLFIKPSPLEKGSESKDPQARHNFWNGKISL